MGGVVERPDPAGDVTQGRLLQPPLREGTIRFTFKVNDNKVLAGVKDLTEMIIAVRAHLHGDDRAVHNGMDATEDVLPLCEHPPHSLRGCGRQGAQVGMENRRRPARPVRESTDTGTSGKARERPRERNRGSGEVTSGPDGTRPSVAQQARHLCANRPDKVSNHQVY